MSQLALPLKLQDHAKFETFWAVGNEALAAFLDEMSRSADGPGCWIWGTPSTGKSHLLQAVCDRVGDRSWFLPLEELRDSGPAVLDGMADRDFVCLDDVHSVIGNREWERALFALFENATEKGSVLVASSGAPPRESGFTLPDLQSRFSLLPAFHVHPLDEREKQNALKLRARHRGLELPDETARFMTTHSRRDMTSLYALLDKLDTEALVAKRRLTIPFVKAVMDR